MNINKIIEEAVLNINEYFINEFGIEVKNILDDRLKEYNISKIEDRFDRRAAFVNRNKKTLTINEFYSSSKEDMLFNLVHELLHILSNKDDFTKKFVEEGIVQLLTYKIMSKKVSQETLMKQFLQDGYRVPVAIMDCIFLESKEKILNYIMETDGYNYLLQSTADMPIISSAILLKSEKCSDFSKIETFALLENLLKQNFDYSDLACNYLLIDYLSKIPISNERLSKMPLIIQDKSVKNRKRDKEKQIIYELYSKNGYQGISNLTYNMGNLPEYNGDDIWGYIWNLIDELEKSESSLLFKQNINNQLLELILSVVYRGQTPDIEEKLIGLLDIENSSAVRAFGRFPKNVSEDIKLNSTDLNMLLNVFLKNELLVESLIDKNETNLTSILESIIEENFEKFGIVDYNVLSHYLRESKKKMTSPQELMDLSEKISKKYKLDSNNFMASPISIWIEDKIVTNENYLQYLNYLNRFPVVSTRETDFFVQSLAYYSSIEPSVEKSNILLDTDLVNPFAKSL